MLDPRPQLSSGLSESMFAFDAAHRCHGLSPYSYESNLRSLKRECRRRGSRFTSLNKLQSQKQIDAFHLQGGEHEFPLSSLCDRIRGRMYLPHQ